MDFKDNIHKIKLLTAEVIKMQQARENFDKKAKDIENAFNLAEYVIRMRMENGDDISDLLEKREELTKEFEELIKEQKVIFETHEKFMRDNGLR